VTANMVDEVCGTSMCTSDSPRRVLSPLQRRRRLRARRRRVARRQARVELPVCIPLRRLPRALQHLRPGQVWTQSRIWYRRYGIESRSTNQNCPFPISKDRLAESPTGSPSLRK